MEIIEDHVPLWVLVLVRLEGCRVLTGLEDAIGSDGSSLTVMLVTHRVGSLLSEVVCGRRGEEICFVEAGVMDDVVKPAALSGTDCSLCISNSLAGSSPKSSLGELSGVLRERTYWKRLRAEPQTLLYSQSSVNLLRLGVVAGIQAFAEGYSYRCLVRHLLP